MRSEIVCIVCPKGCKLFVEKHEGNIEVSGNLCKRGVEYGINEVFNPTRVLTSTVKIDNAIYRRLPVVSSKAIPKSKIFTIMKELNKIQVKAPVKINDIIVENVLDTGVNIIASRTME